MKSSTCMELAYVLVGVVFITSCSKQVPAFNPSNENTSALVIVKSAEPEVETEAENSSSENSVSENSSHEKIEHRQLGAHVHGAASMNVTLEHDQLTTAMSIPGMDAVGFEHAATSVEEETTLNSALSYLQQPNAIFVIPDDAKCQLLKGEVVTALLNKEATENSHADVDISYQWQCKNAPALKNIDVKLFAKFTHLQKIKASWIADEKQGATDLSPAETLLILK